MQPKQSEGMAERRREPEQTMDDIFSGVEAVEKKAAKKAKKQAKAEAEAAAAAAATTGSNSARRTPTMHPSQNRMQQSTTSVSPTKSTCVCV